MSDLLPLSAFAASVWINDQFISTVYNGADQINALFTFPAGSVKAGEDNVVTVLQDNMGNDEDSNGTSPSMYIMTHTQIPLQRNPRVVSPASSSTPATSRPGKSRAKSAATKSKLHPQHPPLSNLTPSRSFPDKVRGVMNEGGLFAEREGWHLPEFDLSSAGFTARDLSAGLPSGGAGVGFFVTTFDLDLPTGTDPQFSFVFDGGVGKTGQAYRALLFVNGWKFGKVRIPFRLCCEVVLIMCVHSAWQMSARRRRSRFPLVSWTLTARSECPASLNS